jgi:hypothetical protein
MSAALLAYIAGATVIAALVLRRRRQARCREDGWRAASGYWETAADRARAERDHAVWELTQERRVHADTAADRDAAVRLLLTQVARLERESAAAVGVAMARIAALSTELAERIAEDDTDAELRELIEQEAGR